MWQPLWPSPPFQSYISGHSTFSMAAAITLADFFGTDNELSPNVGDGLKDQAAAVWDCEDAGLAATSIPSVNLTP